jgi:hypothetical protein
VSVIVVSFLHARSDLLVSPRHQSRPNTATASSATEAATSAPDFCRADSSSADSLSSIILSTAGLRPRVLE